MRSLPEGWTISQHAAEKIVERGVRPDEVADALMSHDVTTPGKGDTQVLWRGDVGVVVDPRQRVIVTVLLHGGSKNDWHEIAEVRERRRTTLSKAMKSLVSTPRQGRHAKPAERRTAPHRSIPVGVHRAIYRTALKEAGGDPDRVRILGPTRVEVLPVADKG